MTDPVAPSPAATLVLIRDRRPAAVEALLLQRHAKSKFAGGDYVFAGGKVEADDVPADAGDFCRGLTAEDAAARLGGGLAPSVAISYWVGAIREAFEEVGLLLAYGPDGELVTFTPENRDRFERYRAECQSSNLAFFAMLRAERLVLATDRLTYFAHWITPEESPIRFDTRFFAATAPPGQEGTVDGREIVGLRWMTLGEVVAAMGAKEISLRPPTLKSLEAVAAAANGGTVADALAALAGRPVPTIRPRILTVDGRPVAVLPGDPRWY